LQHIKLKQNVLPIAFSSENKLIISNIKNGVTNESISLLDLLQLKQVKKLLKRRRLFTVQQLLLLRALFDEEIKKIPNRSDLKRDFHLLPKDIQEALKKNKLLMKKIKFKIKK